jgi:hypothetical protein
VKLKILIIPIIIALIFTFMAGCTKSSPEDIISQYSIYFKNREFDKMYDFLSEKSKGNQTKEEFVKNAGADPSDDESTKLIISQMMDSFEFEPIGSTIDGNEAYVETRITLPDFEQLFSDLLPELFSLAFSSEDFDEEANDLIIDYLNENKLETVKVYRDIRLVYEDGWKIDTSSFELFDFPEIEGGESVEPDDTESMEAEDQESVQENLTSKDEIEIEEDAEAEENDDIPIEPLSKGDSVSVPGWDYKVTEAKAQKTIGEYTARGIYVVALVEIKNTSDSAKQLGTDLFKAEDEQGRIYTMDSSVSLEYYHEYDLNLWHYEDLGPSLSDVVPVVFEVAEDATNIVLVTGGDSSSPIILVDKIK